MTPLTQFKLDDGTTIFLEASDEVKSPKPEDSYYQGETKRGEEALTPKGGLDKAVHHFKDIEQTIRSYTTYTLNAFKTMAVANVEKVTLEFGIKVGGEAGIPYITKGTAESNLKITVECSFPKAE